MRGAHGGVIFPVVLGGCDGEHVECGGEDARDVVFGRELDRGDGFGERLAVCRRLCELEVPHFPLPQSRGPFLGDVVLDRFHDRLDFVPG